MISHEHKAIFVHIPKCAGTSIELALGLMPDPPRLGWQDHKTLADHQRMTLSFLCTKRGLSSLVRRHRLRNHPNPRTQDTVDSDQFAAYFKFSVVRNPWSRVLSYFTDKQHALADGASPSQQFTEFVKDKCGKGHLRPQTHWLRDVRGEISFDFICRHETIADDFSHVARKIGLDCDQLPHALKRNSSNLGSVYTRESADLVANIYSEEIEMFGYGYPY